MGLLITVEGGEFTGKTSVVVPGLLERIQNLGISAIKSREPGGTPDGEKIRTNIFESLKQGADPLKLAHLFNEARAIHIRDVIMTTLGEQRENNAVVILDRYLDSTRVYQGFEAGVPLAKIFALEHEYVGTWFPDITIILYFPPEDFKTVFEERRTQSLDATGRDHTTLDEGTVEFHEKRQAHYLSLPKLSHSLGETRTFFLINAAQPKEKVLDDAWNVLKPLLTV